MQIEKDLKIHLAASKDPGRYAMHGVLHTPGKLTATNGQIAARINVSDDEGDGEGQIVPAALIKAAVSKPGKGTAVVHTNGNGICRAITKAGVVEDKEIDGEFPKVDAVIPDVPQCRRALIGINAQLLLDLVKAIGCENNCARLELDLEELSPDKSYGGPIRITSTYGVGVIMPVTVEHRVD